NTTGKKLTDETLTNSLNISRYTSAYEIDGLVIDVNHASKRRCMVPTRETLNPGYAVKYKIADASNVAVTKVVDVEFTISKNGYLKPTIHIVPTNLNGVTVTKMTGFNAKFIYENKIGPGAEIKVTRSGDVIPLCLGVVKVLQMVIDYDKKYKEWFETQLSNHGRWRWNETEVDAVLIDASEYEEVKIQQTLNFFRSLNAPLLKEGNVRTMFVLHDYSDANHAILSMLNYSEEHWLRYIGANGKKIYSGLRQILNSIPLYMLMGASPFFGRGVGARKFKQLLKGIQIYNIDNLNAITLDQIVNVDGFDLKTANKVLDGIYKFIPFYCGITEKTVIFNEVNTGGTMSGQVVVFTGYRNKQLEKIIEDEGGKVGTSVSGKTTLLTVADPNENSGKLKRAKELNIQIVSEKELKQILGV
ncbi:MAG: BRCT domain-containing protein, partial [Nitrosopumilaceae archaeon]